MDLEILRINMDQIIGYHDALCACIGYFDGLHRGHQQLVLKVLENSVKYNLKPALITFNPDPLQIIKQQSSMKHIMTLEDKMNVARSLGIKVIIVLEIDDRMMRLSPLEFIHQILVSLQVKSIVCGFDFRFGYKGEGSASTLMENSHLFKVDVIDEVDYQNEKISSTRIIKLLKEAQVDEVMTLLGRPYTISGKIVTGHQRGRKIGYPTANLSVNPEYHELKNGVYITSIYVNSKWYPAMTNVGHNVTFDTHDPKRVETYILNFNEMIYGQNVRLAFYKYLRPEMKFDQVEDLVHQMDQDKIQTEAYFSQLNLSMMDEKRDKIVYDIIE